MPTTEVKESLETLKELNMPGSSTDICKAYRIHPCKGCGASIIKGELHYCVIEYPNQKQPYQYHFGCLGGF